MWSFEEEEGQLSRLRPTEMCMQSTPTATLDLSVMIPGAVATLMWSVVSWDTQEETPTRIPTALGFCSKSLCHG